MKKKHIDAFENDSIKVPFVVPNIEPSDRVAIETALKSNLLTDGPSLRKFEKAFAKFTGSKFAIGVSNATSALHLSLKSIGVGKGDQARYCCIKWHCSTSYCFGCFRHWEWR